MPIKLSIWSMVLDLGLKRKIEREGEREREEGIVKSNQSLLVTLLLSFLSLHTVHTHTHTQLCMTLKEGVNT
jgi:hypothetical protein